MERPKYCLYLSRLWPDGPLIRSRMAQWLALSLAVYFLWNLNRLKVYWFQICFTKWKWKWKSLSCVWLFVTPWTTQSMEFSRILEWVAFPFSKGWIFPTQASNPGLRHCRQILYQLSRKGSPLYLTLQRQLFLKFPNSLAPLFSMRSSHLFQLCQTMPKTGENKKRLYMSFMLAER